MAWNIDDGLAVGNRFPRTRHGDLLTSKRSDDTPRSFAWLFVSLTRCAPNFDWKSPMRTDLTDITLVIDRSGSMQSIQKGAEGGVQLIHYATGSRTG